MGKKEIMSTVEKSRERHMIGPILRLKKARSIEPFYQLKNNRTMLKKQRNPLLSCGFVNQVKMQNHQSE